MHKLKTIVLFILLINSICYSQINKTKQVSFNLSGKVTQTSAYCGGAAPSEEMMAEYAKAKPYAGKTFYIRKGNVNSLKKKVILSFKADENGKFSFQLPPGIYSIIQEVQVNKLNVNKYNTKGSLHADVECLKKWWLKPYYILY
ncbi:MAG: prealbumin-like fold domain-containing protein [Bacteroidetes bacterium]|nr:prealbumin-like fold domain-containing protein [Bacteroidota bacterium]